jgi:hypothetical protein
MSYFEVSVLVLLILNLLISLVIFDRNQVFESLTEISTTNDAIAHALENIRHIIGVAYKVDEKPKPGKMQPNIKPVVISDEELFNRELDENNNS